jgi:hypothetical protein
MGALALGIQWVRVVTTIEFVDREQDDARHGGVSRVGGVNRNRHSSKLLSAEAMLTDNLRLEESLIYSVR